MYRIETIKGSPTIYTAQYRSNIFQEWVDIGEPTTKKSEAQKDIDLYKSSYEAG